MANANFQSLLSDWQSAKHNMALWQAQERALRDQVVAAAFPKADEGTNKRTLPDGRILKAICGVNRTIENSDKLDAILDKLEKAGVDVDALVPFKPSLGKRAYDQLSPKHRALIDEVITSKPAAAQLSIE